MLPIIFMGRTLPAIGENERAEVIIDLRLKTVHVVVGNHSLAHDNF